jgi:excinuclease UvrABC helicase subunit UvrB
MDKNFNDLFDEFFFKKNLSDSDFYKKININIKQLFDLLKNVKTNEIDGKTDMSLGEPDSVESYSDGFFFFEKKVWHTPNGDIIKITASDNTDNLHEPEKTLQEQLDEAINNENYEKAAQIRDLMNPPKKKKSTKKK